MWTNPTGIDLTNQKIIINEKYFLPVFQGLEHRTVTAFGGFGCNPESSGRTVMVRYADGQADSFYRQDVEAVWVEPTKEGKLSKVLVHVKLLVAAMENIKTTYFELDTEDTFMFDEGYPFHRSLDELTIDAADWAESMELKISKEKEDSRCTK